MLLGIVLRRCAGRLREGSRGECWIGLNSLKQVQFRYDVSEVHGFSKLSRRLMC